MLLIIKSQQLNILYEMNYKGKEVLLNSSYSSNFRCIMNIQNKTDKILRFEFKYSYRIKDKKDFKYTLKYCFHNERLDDCQPASEKIIPNKFPIPPIRPIITPILNWWTTVTNHHDITRQNFSFISLYINETTYIPNPTIRSIPIRMKGIYIFLIVLGCIIFLGIVITLIVLREKIADTCCNCDNCFCYCCYKKSIVFRD